MQTRNTIYAWASISYICMCGVSACLSAIYYVLTVWINGWGSSQKKFKAGWWFKYQSICVVVLLHSYEDIK